MAYLDSNGLETQISYIKGYVQGELSNFTPSGSFLPLAGGTMMGDISWEHGAVGYKPTAHTSTDSCRQLMVTAGEVNEAWDSPNAKIALHIYDSTGTNTAEDGGFSIQASDGTNIPTLTGRPNGNLTWGSNKIATFDSNNKLVFPNGTTVWIS